jgi:hypothetical protein
MSFIIPSKQNKLEMFSGQTLQPKDGVLWILDATEDGSVGFTDFGIETVREMLGDASTMEDFLQDQA